MGVGHKKTIYSILRTSHLCHWGHIRHQKPASTPFCHPVRKKTIFQPRNPSKSQSYRISMRLSSYGVIKYHFYREMLGEGGLIFVVVIIKFFNIWSCFRSTKIFRKYSRIRIDYFWNNSWSGSGLGRTGNDLPDLKRGSKKVRKTVVKSLSLQTQINWKWGQKRGCGWWSRLHLWEAW